MITSTRAPGLADAEYCARQTRRAAFLAPSSDLEELPCIEVAGVQAYLYLDAESGQVRVSVHLDDAAAEIRNPDATVPVRITVNGHAVYNET